MNDKKAFEFMERERVYRDLEKVHKVFHEACQNIVDNADEKALNYCVGYAKAGLKMTNRHYILAQIPYILDNMTRWHGPIARETRSILKNIQRYYS